VLHLDKELVLDGGLHYFMLFQIQLTSALRKLIRWKKKALGMATDPTRRHFQRYSWTPRRAATNQRNHRKFHFKQAASLRT